MPSVEDSMYEVPGSRLRKLTENAQEHVALQRRFDELEERYKQLKREDTRMPVGDHFVYRTTIEDAEGILQYHAGLDMTSPHGKDTPKRFITMLEELTQCRDCSGDCMKWKVFDEEVDQMVVLNKIPFSSVCNHHVVPFVGFAWVGYVPDGSVAGLSKFARVVHHFARRLQVQERLTQQVAEFLEKELQPKGVIVVTEAEHLCMTIRGVQTPGTTTRVVETRGVFSDHSRTAKHEFLMGIK